MHKRFRVYDRPLDRLKEWLTPKGVSYHWAYWALRDISFEVERGASLGIIGANGAGKSTLLKILCGTLCPTHGAVAIHGRITGLLELGCGFHPEFTGRQNIYLNARLLGLSDAEIEEKLPAIMAFAEIDDFIDHPLRIYSTGMALRLGFSVAANIDPDILIIDEALAVGDAYFQQKCIKHLRAFREKGGTLLFVSHDPGAVKLLCDRAILLYEGRVLSDGAPDDVLDDYNAIIARNVTDHTLKRIEESSRKRHAAPMRAGSFDAVIRAIDITTNGVETRSVVAGEDLRITVSLIALSDIPAPAIGIMIRDRLGYDIFGTNTHRMKHEIAALRAGEEVQIHFALPGHLSPGDYTITAAAHTGDDHLEECFDWADKFIAFHVLPGREQYSDGILRMPVTVESTVSASCQDDAHHVLEKVFADAPSCIRVDDTTCAWMFSGWHKEEVRDGWHYRWTTQRATCILRTGNAGVVAMRAACDGQVCAQGGVGIHLTANGVACGEQRIATADRTTVRFTLPTHLRATIVKCTFEITPVFVPAECSDSTDTRTLGVMVEEVSAT